MRKSITLRAFPADMPTLERVDLARRAGYDAVEINLEPTEEFPLETDPAVLVDLRREIERRGMAVSAVYCRDQWRRPITSLDLGTRDAGATILRRLVGAATALGADIVLVVPGAVDNRIFVQPPEIVPYRVAYDNALGVLREVLRDTAEPAGVRLAIENVWNKFLLSPLEFASFVDALGSPMAGAYFDVGNVLRTGFPQDWIGILGERIVAVQVKDFRLDVDTLAGFVGLLQGDVDWPAVRQALADIGYDGWITSEVLPAYRHSPERLIHETAAAIDAIFGTTGGGDAPEVRQRKG